MPNEISPFDLNKRCNETQLLEQLVTMTELDQAARDRITARATKLVQTIRSAAQPSMMEVFLSEYGLSSDEGVALMCLAEALLRVPDTQTIDALIEDKIAQSDWSRHIGQSSSPLVNASTWGLLMTGKVLNDQNEGIVGTLQAMVRRMGEPVIRTAVAAAMRQMGRQFVLGETIKDAMGRARELEEEGYTYSYDMLGEAAMTAKDANRYADAYADAISALADAFTDKDIVANPGISVKFSALHPRYEVAKSDRVLTELVPIVTKLAKQAAAAGMGFNVDAEEADRLSLSLQVIKAVLADPDLAGWDGFGVVVQAYSRRASFVIGGLYQMAQSYDRKIMVRLVKGAYWDTEIKLAQVEGFSDFPVFTRKAGTDVSYLANARSLLNKTDRIYPQFATHNAHTVAAILDMASGLSKTSFEFQRLHGMGEELHDIVHKNEGTQCRIYAPVGAHKDLLAYLVRRLLENGANSSFVNQIVDADIPPTEVATCPFSVLAQPVLPTEPIVKNPKNLFQPERPNSIGFDLSDTTELAHIFESRLDPKHLTAKPILAGNSASTNSQPVLNPATGEQIGEVTFADDADVQTALTNAKPWNAPVSERAEILVRAADLYEENFGPLFSLLAKEAGKTLMDAVAELREAVDFLRYYSARARLHNGEARGVFTCISPWNFPLAIFTGQIAAALATGNAVLAKPAETTPMIAELAIKIMHQAGVPVSALQYLPGLGHTVGAALTSDARINGVAFTGSTKTARAVQGAMAVNCNPGTPLIAETGGLNAMIVDSTALPEQATKDILVSAFQSAGQRCSALRCLYIQEDVAETFLEMLTGAMDQLSLGDPWDLDTDIGPVITSTAKEQIDAYVNAARQEGRVLHQLTAPLIGNFVGPAIIKVNSIADLEQEVFGPILHVATFQAEALEDLIEEINATGYGLTFGLHTRIDDRVQTVAANIHAGNIYANRNQIGAIVGSQPFGGEGLSGTGPKAGGPNYLSRFVQSLPAMVGVAGTTEESASKIAAQLKSLPTGKSKSVTLPGPTGELNRLTIVPRAPILCLGPTEYIAKAQKDAVEALGGQAVTASGMLPADALQTLPEFGAALWWGDEESARAYSISLAERDGPIIPLITLMPDAAHVNHERHLCVDMTAAGGDASLLAGQPD